MAKDQRQYSKFIYCISGEQKLCEYNYDGGYGFDFQSFTQYD